MVTVLSLIALSGSLGITPAFAKPIKSTGSTTTSSVGGGRGAKNFCTTLPETKTKVLAKIDGRMTKFDQIKADTSAKLTELRESRDEKRLTTRATEEQKRLDRIMKLDEKTTTGAHKDAIATFKTQMADATKKRTTAVDAAVAEYRAGVDAIRNGKTASTATALAARKSAVEAAIKTAETACALGTDPVAVAKQFNEAVKKVETSQLQSEGEVKKLAEARKEKVAGAHETFKAEATKARETLKAALGQK